MTREDFNKLVSKYEAIPDEYYEGEQDLCGDLLKSSVRRHMNLQPGHPAEVWELMAGSGRFSKTAADRQMKHLPPIDLRWGCTSVE